MLQLVLSAAMALSLLPTAASAALWTSTPSGSWNCDLTSNGCIAHTGFNPLKPYWGQATSSQGNCTNYVAYRLSMNGAADPGFRGSGGAKNWARVLERVDKKRVNGTASVGSIAWWPAGHRHFSAGHVAYVEKIVNGTVYLSDSSFPFTRAIGGSSRWTVRKGDSRWPTSFLHVKDKPKPKPKKPSTKAPPESSEPEPASGVASPKGNFEAVSSPAVGQIQVRGWAYDPDASADQIDVHIYVGGKNHKVVTAELERKDVAAAFADSDDPGPYHGFDTTFSTSLKGKQEVCVYAINVPTGSNPKIGCKTVTVKAPATTTPPPPPPRTVTLAKGSSAQGLAGCVSIYCRYMAVSFKNFSSASHTIVCRASGYEGGFYSYQKSGSSGSSAVCYYGYPGSTVWVTVDGVGSNKIVW